MNQNSTNHSPDEIRERASLYTLGALTAAEAIEFEQHLASGCTACGTEVHGFQAVADELVHALPAESPRSFLRTRVLERIAQEADQANWTTLSKDGLSFIRAQRLPWLDMPGLGVEVKLLSTDAERKLNTQLVRMNPGAVVPRHRHGGKEEIFLIEGEALVCGVVMHSGDYCSAEAGSIHESITTQNGCVFISITSIEDEYF
jgi:anti-sigma factor ChrR (cupin superfamily)